MKDCYMSIRPCPVCQTHQGSVLTELSYALFDDLKISGDKKIIQCHKCGMRYDDVNFSESQLQEYYLSNEHYAASAVGGAGSISDDNKERYDRIIDMLKPEAKGVILDFGCGQGGFISRCIEHGLESVGIEPSTKSREVAKKSGLHTYGSIDEFVTKNSDCKVQAVVFSHVLEHLINPMQLIQDFSKYFNNALVYIEVPDADSYLLPNNIRWNEMYFEHLSHFRKQNIAELARCSHVEIKKEGVIPFSKLQEDIRSRPLWSLFNKIVASCSSIGKFVITSPPHTAIGLPPRAFSTASKGDVPLTPIPQAFPCLAATHMCGIEPVLIEKASDAKHKVCSTESASAMFVKQGASPDTCVKLNKESGSPFFSETKALAGIW